MSSEEKIRLNKHLALQLGVSRREADELIEEGKVAVNGSVVKLGYQISDGDTITVNGKPVAANTPKQTILFHKPVGYVCSRKAQGDAPTIYDLLPVELHVLKPVGRLDKDSSGLLLLSNDGDFAHQMTHPSFQKTKVYEVQLDKPLEPLHQQMISDFGVILDDGKSKFELQEGHAPPLDSGMNPESTLHPLKLEQSSRAEAVRIRWTITMKEGRNRQIRRTFAALGYRVIKLHRTQFGSYYLHNLDQGDIAKA